MIVCLKDLTQRTIYKNIGHYPDEELKNIISEWYVHFDNWADTQEFMDQNLKRVKVSEDETNEYWYII